MALTTNSPTARAIVGLSTHCDHARSLDGVGFNRTDAETGNDIARKLVVYGTWASEKQMSFARKIIRKCHRQIEAMGITMDEINADTFATAAPESKAAPETVDILVEYSSHTEKAIQVLVGADCSAVWLPKSQIIKSMKMGAGIYKLTVPAWIAKAKDITETVGA